MKDISQMREHIEEAIDDADDVTVEKAFQILEDEGDDFTGKYITGTRSFFLRGLKDADEGRTTPHEEGMKKYEKWLMK